MQLSGMQLSSALFKHTVLGFHRTCIRSAKANPYPFTDLKKDIVLQRSVPENWADDETQENTNGALDTNDNPSHTVVLNYLNYFQYSGLSPSPN